VDILNDVIMEVDIMPPTNVACIEQSLLELTPKKTVSCRPLFIFLHIYGTLYSTSLGLFLLESCN